MAKCILCGESMSIPALIMVSKWVVTDLTAPVCFECIGAQWEVLTGKVGA